MATDSYEVCQNVVESVSDTDVDLAWQFIDTLSVRSTRACRAMIAKFKGTRSAGGFRREHMRASASPLPHRPMVKHVPRPTLAGYSDKDREGYPSLDCLVAHDCMHWVLTSSDPTASALLFRSRFI